jgi:hypothetical protein
VCEEQARPNKLQAGVTLECLLVLSSAEHPAAVYVPFFLATQVLVICHAKQWETKLKVTISAKKGMTECEKCARWLCLGHDLPAEICLVHFMMVCQ